MNNTGRFLLPTLLLLLLALCACTPDDSAPAGPTSTAPPPATATTPATPSLPTPTFPYAILPPETAGEQGADRMLQADELWLPETADIVAMEAALADYVDGLTGEQQTAGIKARDYWRQYVGFMRGGQHYIFGNYFCREEANWQTDLLIISDGGDCYVEVVYNLERNTIEQFIVHGEA